MAAALAVIGGAATVTAEIVADPNRSDFVFSLASTLIFGVILWFLPWDRLGSAGTLGFMALSMLALFFGSIETDGIYHPVEVPVLLLVLFAWNGIAHNRWISVAFAFPALFVYVGPGLLGFGEVPEPIAIILTISFAVLTGESISWVATKLTTAEAERLLHRYRADFLNAAHHELRTPLTAIKGYLRLLESRFDDMSEEEREEAIQAISRSVARLERFTKRLVDVDRIRRGESLELDELGLLASHYGEGEIDLADPLRGANE
jgi:signal transduction histidine kinase